MLGLSRKQLYARLRHHGLSYTSSKAEVVKGEASFCR
jgi:hypothetical protein